MKSEVNIVGSIQTSSYHASYLNTIRFDSYSITERGAARRRCGMWVSLRKVQNDATRIICPATPFSAGHHHLRHLARTRCRRA
jgi:hypothetical protein